MPGEARQIDFVGERGERIGTFPRGERRGMGGSFPVHVGRSGALEAGDKNGIASSQETGGERKVCADGRGEEKVGCKNRGR